MKNTTKNWTLKTLKRTHTFYATCLGKFNAQYKNVSVIDKVFINNAGLVFAAEWKDENGIHNMIGGIYPDIKKTIEFID